MRTSSFQHKSQETFLPFQSILQGRWDTAVYPRKRETGEGGKRGRIVEKRDQWKEENSFVVMGSEGRIRKSPVREVGELSSEGGGLFTSAAPPPPQTPHFTPASFPSTNPSPIVETRDISKSFFISNLKTCFRVQTCDKVHLLIQPVNL